MQRTITYQDALKAALLAVGLLIYGIGTTIYPFSPPLLGLLAFSLYERPNRSMLLIVLGYILLFEAERGGVLFSGWGILALYLLFVMPYLGIRLICHYCLPTVGIGLFYLLYAAAGWIEAAIFMHGIQIEPLFLLYYAFIEILLRYMRG